MFQAHLLESSESKVCLEHGSDQLFCAIRLPIQGSVHIVPLPLQQSSLWPDEKPMLGSKCRLGWWRLASVQARGGKETQNWWLGLNDSLASVRLIHQNAEADGFSCFSNKQDFNTLSYAYEWKNKMENFWHSSIFIWGEENELAYLRKWSQTDCQVYKVECVLLGMPWESPSQGRKSACARIDTGRRVKCTGRENWWPTPMASLLPPM